jgi:succinate dehydrogenase/fumarate reductase flavoprotein subunit
LGDKNSLCWRESIGEIALSIKGKVSTTYAVLGSSVKGLYAGGDDIQGASVGGAAVFGWIAGGNTATYARGAETPSYR